MSAATFGMLGRTKTARVSTAATLALLLGVLGFALAGCARESTATVHADEVGWRTYINKQLGYRLEYPDYLAPYDHGPEVIFRTPGPLPFRTPFTGSVPALVRWETEEEGRSRGAWFGADPAGEVTFGGRTGTKYVYVHHDGPSADPTVAYVVPFRGKYLGVEFRTGGELDAVQQRMLESFRFE